MDDRLDASVVAAGSGNDAVMDADIVVTATTSPTPVFDGHRLSPGTHVTAMGQSHPDRREVDTRTVARSRYVPDLRERALGEAGAFLAALAEGAVDEDHVHAELGEVVAGRSRGREADDEVTLFDSAGTAIETVAAAAMLYEKATERGLGTPIDLTPASAALEGFGGT
jgi:alanine dehydrogenase